VIMKLTSKRSQEEPFGKHGMQAGKMIWEGIRFISTKGSLTSERSQRVAKRIRNLAKFGRASF